MLWSYTKNEEEEEDDEGEGEERKAMERVKRER